MQLGGRGVAAEGEVVAGGVEEDELGALVGGMLEGRGDGAHGAGVETARRRGRQRDA